MAATFSLSIFFSLYRFQSFFDVKVLYFCYLINCVLSGACEAMRKEAKLQFNKANNLGSLFRFVDFLQTSQYNSLSLQVEIFVKTFYLENVYC